MRKRKRLRPFVPVRKDMLENSKWRKLSSAAKVVYLYLRDKANGDTKHISLPYSELSDMMANQTIANAFKELQARGFIKQVYKGGKYGSPALYDFTGEFADPYESKRPH